MKTQEEKQDLHEKISQVPELTKAYNSLSDKGKRGISGKRIHELLELIKKDCIGQPKKRKAFN